MSLNQMPNKAVNRAPLAPVAFNVGAPDMTFMSKCIIIALTVGIMASCGDDEVGSSAISVKAIPMPAWALEITAADITRIQNEMQRYQESERARHGSKAEVRGCCGVWPDHPQILYAEMVIQDAQVCLEAIASNNMKSALPAFERMRLIHIQNQVNHDSTIIPDEKSLQQGGELGAASRRQLP